MTLLAIASLVGCASRRIDPALAGAWFPADDSSGLVISAKGYGYLISKSEFLDKQTNSMMSFTVRDGNLVITPLDEEGGGEGGPGYTSPYHLRGDDLELDQRADTRCRLDQVSGDRAALEGLWVFRAEVSALPSLVSLSQVFARDQAPKPVPNLA